MTIKPFYPNQPSSPSQEIESAQPKLKTNGETLYNTFSYDHVWANENAQLAGDHRRVSMAPLSIDPLNNTEAFCFWSNGTQVKSNFGSTNTYNMVIAQENALPYSGAVSFIANFTILTNPSSPVNLRLAWDVIVSPMVGTNYYFIDIVFKNSISSSTITPVFLFIPYGFTIANGILAAFGGYVGSPTVIRAGSASQTTPQWVNVTVSQTYLNGVYMFYSNAFRNSMQIIGS